MPVQSWFNQAAEQLKVAYVNSGVNGDTTEGMVARFGSVVLRRQPTHVIIMGGTNDAYLGSDATKVTANLRYMAELAATRGIVPIIGLPIPCNDLVAELLLGQYRRAIRKYASAGGRAVLDFYTALADQAGKIKVGFHCDGLHPNEAGYSAMAGVAVDGLRSIVKL